MTEKLSRKIHIVRCDFAVKQRFLKFFLDLQQPSNPFFLPYNFVHDSFHTGVMAEGLRAKIDRKSAILHQRGQLDQKFQARGVAPHQ